MLIFLVLALVLFNTVVNIKFLIVSLLFIAEDFLLIPHFHLQ